MVAHLNSPQPVFPVPSLDGIPDTDEDQPVAGIELDKLGPLQLPVIVFGAATFGSLYNVEELYTSHTPLRTTRLALRYGIRAFDSSPWYGHSEIVLGSALKALESEFPRSSYQLMTKCGRYGPKREDWDYSPATLRASVKRSLARLHTDYLDTVYLHDVEFVCTPVGPNVPGDQTLALSEKKAEYGLAEGEEGKIWGPGDQVILDAVAELRKMQGEGLIKTIGITGYPLPTLLRIALLVLHTAPYKPLDVLLSYSQLHLQNTAFAAFAPHLRARARVPQLLSASPLNMGLFSPTPPAWHPAPPELRAATELARARALPWAGGLAGVAVGFSYGQSEALGAPNVVGMSNLREVHDNVRVWRELKEGKDREAREAVEAEVGQLFEGMRNWAWASPPPGV